jgi:hypothetical protein
LLALVVQVLLEQVLETLEMVAGMEVFMLVVVLVVVE